MPRTLRDQLPWVRGPIVGNAPMGGFAGGALAAAVSNAGGLGQIGTTFDVAAIEKDLEQAKSSLSAPSAGPAGTLPVGVGLLPFAIKLDQVLPVLVRYTPAVLWLFAARELTDYKGWAERLRTVLPHTSIWVQVGNVTAALAVARDVKPDALILQGSDAGGHGFERGASIVSLLPEATDLLKVNGLGDIPLLAAGGIVDARGAAAAFALGADGVILGTRFLAARETVVPEGYRELLLSTTDGGVNTVKSKLFDNVRGPNIWPEAYDGRSLVTESYRDHVAGVDIAEVRSRHNKAAEGDDQGFGKTNRSNVWAGAGVGLVNKIEDAASILDEVRRQVKTVLNQTSARL